jgi:hypothetical protein
MALDLAYAQLSYEQLLELISRPLAENERLLNEIGRHYDRGNLLRFLHEPMVVEPSQKNPRRRGFIQIQHRRADDRRSTNICGQRQTVRRGHFGQRVRILESDAGIFDSGHFLLA